MLPIRKSLALQLCKAVNEGEPRVVEALLLQGANPNLVLPKGVAAVHLAAGKETEKRIRCLQLLLQYGADPNVRSVEDLTPVHIAALWGCYKNLKLLLQNGGNPSLEDQDGNKAADLAKQQENRRCARLLQEYHSWDALEVEHEDVPQFEYSFYHGQDGRDSTGLQSLLSDFGDGPLSSTWRSSLLHRSQINSRPSWTDMSHLSALSNRELDRDPATPSLLSSTRVSAGGPGTQILPAVDKEAPLVDCRMSQPKDPVIRETPSDAFFLTMDSSSSSRCASRKSVSFKDMDEVFTVFDAQSPEQLEYQGSHSSGDTTVDFSEYPEFLNSERMATVLQNQGIDVTSPDHVFVFSRHHDCASPDLDKTVPGHLLGEGDDGQLVEVKNPVETPSCSSSSTGTSEYSSCDSDHYTTAVGLSCHHKDASPASGNSKIIERACEDYDSAGTPLLVSACKTASQHQPPVADGVFSTDDSPGKLGLDADLSKFKQGVQSPFVPTKTRLSTPGLAAMVKDRTLSPETPFRKLNDGDLNEEPSDILGERAEPLPTDGEMVNREVMDAFKATSGCDGQEVVLPLTPSPFVTGRTRSRLSRCSLRNNSNVGTKLLSSTSSLFEDTLPAPVRLHRFRTRVQNSSRARDCMPSSGLHSSPVNLERGEASFVDSNVQSCKTIQTNTSTLDSQADTLIISGSAADTLILEKECSEVLTDSSKSMLVCPGDAAADVGEFLTDDSSSSNEVKSSDPLNSADSQEEVCCFGSSAQEPWITDDLPSGDSQSEAGPVPTVKYDCSSPEPRSDLPATPASGCTPRYSITRLSACQKPQSLANLSYTPGGRSLILDQDKPMEYLYTDFEEGHKLIECHVPPTANVTLNSDHSTVTSEDTILYDWRSLQLSPKKGKENIHPQKENLPDVSGLTDKELRKKLKDLGEDPGPINILTRPHYIQKLRQLQQEAVNRQPVVQNPEYSAELASALHTFTLPDCQTDELALCQQFDQPDQNRKWREGIIKSSFNYLLLDPRVTKNLPCRSTSMTPMECFQIFVKAIFYIGKGKRSRPYSHLYEGLDYYKGDKTSKKLCSKVQHILQVWRAGLGVISLHCFQNVIPVEAYTREACMVDAIAHQSHNPEPQIYPT